MKEFRVGYHYEEAGVVTVNASSQEEANKIVYDHLEEHGLENMGNYDTNHRHYFVEEG